MVDTTRYTKTEKGAEEIRSRGKNLRGRMRTMLILIDPSKSGDELRASAAQIGVEPEFLEMLVRDPDGRRVSLQAPLPKHVSA